MDKNVTGVAGKTESTGKKIYQKPILREFGSVHMTTQGSRGGMEDGAGMMAGGTMGMGMRAMGNMGMGMGFLNTG